MWKLFQFSCTYLKKIEKCLQDNLHLSRPLRLELYALYSVVHLIALFSCTWQKKVLWNYYFGKEATANNCNMCARIRNILLRQVCEAAFGNFPLRIPLTLRENSGNVSGKFFQRNNCRSCNIAGESRPRAGNVLSGETGKEGRGRRTKTYIIFRYARYPTIMHGVRCMGSITYHNKYESAFYAIMYIPPSNDRRGKIYGSMARNRKICPVITRKYNR